MTVPYPATRSRVYCKYNCEYRFEAQGTKILIFAYYINPPPPGATMRVFTHWLKGETSPRNITLAFSKAIELLEANNELELVLLCREYVPEEPATKPMPAGPPQRSLSETLRSINLDQI